MIRFVTLLAVPSGGDRAVLRTRVDGEAARIAAALGDRGEVRHSLATTRGPAATESDFDIESSDFGAVIEVLLPDEDDIGAALDAFAGLAGRLGDAIDAEQSAAIVGEEHLIVPGTGALEIHVALRRNPALGVDAFRACWSNEFAPLAATTPHMAGYLQVHAIDEESLDAAKATGLGIADFDGVAVEWFPSPDQLMEAAAWSEASEAHVEIRGRFLDQAKARSLLSDNPSA